MVMLHTAKDADRFPVESGVRMYRYMSFGTAPSAHTHLGRCVLCLFVLPSPCASLGTFCPDEAAEAEANLHDIGGAEYPMRERSIAKLQIQVECRQQSRNRRARERGRDE